MEYVSSPTEGREDEPTSTIEPKHRVSDTNIAYEGLTFGTG